MVIKRLRVRCPACGRNLEAGRDTQVPFVRFEMLCTTCGATVEVIHPQYAGRDLSRLPRCLDCGNPIPEIKGPHASPFRFLAHTCPMCWVSHRNGEPGGDLDAFIKTWYRHGAVAKPPGSYRLPVCLSRTPPRKKGDPQWP